tara:strand:- start:535 stop:795 length:261 start_codon:yes stop_codon:yes gene_type:complete
MYTVHELKVYDNSVLITQQQASYDSLVRRRDELLDLVDLFAKDSIRVVVHSERKKVIKSKYNPCIKEAKRLLMNSKKRLEYNFNRC